MTDPGQYAAERTTMIRHITTRRNMYRTRYGKTADTVSIPGGRYNPLADPPSGDPMYPPQGPCRCRAWVTFLAPTAESEVEIGEAIRYTDVLEETRGEGMPASDKPRFGLLVGLALVVGLLPAGIAGAATQFWETWESYANGVPPCGDWQLGSGTGFTWGGISASGLNGTKCCTIVGSPLGATIPSIIKPDFADPLG
jgi:hypothetical protein